MRSVSSHGSFGIPFAGVRSHSSLRLALWFGFGLGLLSLGLASWRFLATQGKVLSRSLLWPLGLSLIVAGIPALIAFISALLTARRVRDANYELLLVTAISDRRLALGHLLSALEQAQILLALSLGLTPAIAVGMLESALQAEIFACQPDFSLKSDFNAVAHYTNCTLPSANASLIWLLMGLGLWGLAWMAVPLGVAVVLGWRSMLAATLAAPIIAAALSFGLYGWALSPITLGSTDAILWIARLTTPAWPMWRESLLFMLTPYLLTLLFIYIAYRWARRT